MKQETIKLYDLPSYPIRYTEISLMSNSEKSVYAAADKETLAEESKIVCTRCSLNTRLCAGHMTRISFTFPIIHFMFIKEIKDLVSLTCFECANPYESENIVSLLRNAIVNNIDFKKIIIDLRKDITSGTRQVCGNIKCGKPVKIFQGNEIQTYSRFYYKTSGGSERHSVSTLEVRDLFKRMKREKYSKYLLALLEIEERVHIEEFLPLIILATPSKDRPPIITSTRGNPKNTMTHIYENLLRISQEMRNYNVSHEHVENLVKEASDKYHILINGKSVDGTGKLKGGIFSEIKGKTGIRRKNMGTVRPFGSARGVAAGHPGDPTVVVLPTEFLDNTPYPEIVTSGNIEELQDMLNKGTIFSVTIPGRDMGPIRFRPDTLRIGYTAMRRARTGDICLISRQPEVHGGSIIPLVIYESKTMSKTFGIPVNRTASLGADFDGDELNANIGQTLSSNEDILDLYYSDQIMINPGNSSAMMGIQFSGIIAAYLLTEREDMKPEEFFNSIALLLMPKYNPLLDENEFTLVQKEDVFYESDYMDNITEYFKENNRDIISRAISNGVLDDSMFFWERSIRDLSYYYTIPEGIEETLDEMFDLLAVHFNNGLFDYFEYMTSWLDQSYRIRVREGIESTTIMKFKMLDFILREDLEAFCSLSTKVKIASIRGEYVEFPSGEYYLESYISPSFFHIDYEEEVMYIDPSHIKALSSDVNKIRRFLDLNTIGNISGRFVFSISLPYYTDYEHSGVVIKNGMLIKGVIKSTHISTSQNSLVVHIANSQNTVDGPFIEESINFITILNRILMNFYNYEGFTYSLEDIVGNIRGYSKYHNVTKKEKIKSYTKLDINLDKIFRDNNCKIPSGLAWENFQKELLSTISTETTRLTKIVKQYVNFKNIDKYTKSGAKGKDLNNTQTSYLIGPIFVASNLYISPDAKTLDHDSVSVTLDSYIEGFGSFIESVQSNSARFAISSRHSAVPKVEDSSTINAMTMRKTVSDNNFRSIKMGGQKQLTIQDYYGYDGLDSTRILNNGKGGLFPNDIESVMNYSMQNFRS